MNDTLDGGATLTGETVRQSLQSPAAPGLGRRQLGRLALEEAERAVDGAAPRLQPVVHHLDLLLRQHAR
jgi:hypothetical protein